MPLRLFCPALRRLCLPPAIGLAVALAVGLAGPPASRGHDVLAGYIQHHLVISLGAEHLDLTVHLTFFEDGSEHEREHMDANGDGQLSRAETAAYLKQLESRLADTLKLRLAGKPVDLVPLREPELDLLGHTRTGRWHHRLSLFFFAATPPELAAGAELVVEDRLWPATRAVGLLQVEGRDGAKLEPVPLRDSLLPPARKGEAREFKVRVISPPKAASAQPAQAPSAR